MPIEFTCPHCEHEFFVADRFAGQSGNCAKCSQSITVPGTAAEVPFAPGAGYRGRHGHADVIARRAIWMGYCGRLFWVVLNAFFPSANRFDPGHHRDTRYSAQSKEAWHGAGRVWARHGASVYRSFGFLPGRGDAWRVASAESAPPTPGCQLPHGRGHRSIGNRVRNSGK